MMTNRRRVLRSRPNDDPVERYWCHRVFWPPSPQPGAARADDLPCISTTFRFLGANDRVCVSAFDDPKVPGVACQSARRAPAASKALSGWPRTRRGFSIACRQVGPISSMSPDLPGEESVYSARTSVFFKHTHVYRIVDKPRNTLIYLCDQRQDHRRLAAKRDLDRTDDALGALNCRSRAWQRYTAETEIALALFAMLANSHLRPGLNPVRRRAVEQLRRIVLDALGNRPAEVWLFGSSARGDPRQHSDIDIGVLPQDELLPRFSPSLRQILRRARSRSMSIWSICGMQTPRWSRR